MRALEALKEDPVTPLRGDHAIHLYRFTCVPTWGEPFCVILRVQPDGCGEVLWKMAVAAFRERTRSEMLADALGKGPKRQGHWGRVSRRHLKSFLELVQSQGYWQLDTHDDSIGFGGSCWLVEGVCCLGKHA